MTDTNLTHGVSLVLHVRAGKIEARRAMALPPPHGDAARTAEAHAPADRRATTVRGDSIGSKFSRRGARCRFSISTFPPVGGPAWPWGPPGPEAPGHRASAVRMVTQVCVTIETALSSGAKTVHLSYASPLQYQLVTLTSDDAALSRGSTLRLGLTSGSAPSPVCSLSSI
jgi:hypothetical protein